MVNRSDIASMAKKLLEIRFISSKDQLADRFTKPITIQQLQRNLKLDKDYIERECWKWLAIMYGYDKK
jgi:hypothetical protein